MKLVFIADAHPSIGYGHVVRTLAFARHLEGIEERVFYSSGAPNFLKDDCSKFGIEMVNLEPRCYLPLDTLDSHFEWAVNETFFDVEADWVVIDGYSFGAAWEKFFQAKGIKVFRLDDMNNRKYYVNAILNAGGSGLSYNAYSDTRCFLGLEYALLRPEFFSNSNPVSLKREGWVLCIGGSDAKHLTNMYIDLLLTKHQVKKLSVIITKSFSQEEQAKILSRKDITCYKDLSIDEMVAIMDASEFGVFSASNIALEGVARKLKCFVFQYVENQKFVYESLLQKAWVKPIEKLGEDWGEAVVSFHSRLKDIKDYLKASVHMKVVFETELDFRPAQFSDLYLTFVWANDRVTRFNAKQIEAIPFNHHQSWFLSKIKDESCRYLIAECGGKPCGVLRLDFDKNEQGWYIDYAVAERFRGHGIGTKIITHAQSLGLKLIAQVKKENKGSCKVFDKTGFTIIPDRESEDQGLYKFEY